MNKVSDSKKQRIVEAYQLNPNKTAVGRQFGVSARTVGRYLEEAGMTPVVVETPVEETPVATPQKEAWVMSPSSVTIQTPDGMKTLGAGHRNYDDIRLALLAGEYEKACDLIDIPKAIERLSQGDISVSDGILYYKGYEVHNIVTSIIIDKLNEGVIDTKALNFLENLMANPSKRSVDELWGFLEAGNMPITDDGHFLAYKRVNSDYTDVYTSSIDNSVGQVVEMPRNMVNDNKEQTCSDGLHFCSAGYLGSFGGSRIMVLKINPMDVVSIPVDYNLAKGRCCKYQVIGEVYSPAEIFDYL